MEDYGNGQQYTLPPAHLATFLVRFQRRYLFKIFFNGDDIRSRNYTESWFTLVFLHLRQKNRTNQSPKSYRRTCFNLQESTVEPRHLLDYIIKGQSWYIQ